MARVEGDPKQTPGILKRFANSVAENKKYIIITPLLAGFNLLPLVGLIEIPSSEGAFVANFAARMVVSSVVLFAMIDEDIKKEERHQRISQYNTIFPLSTYWERLEERAGVRKQQ